MLRCRRMYHFLLGVVANVISYNAVSDVSVLPQHAYALELLHDQLYEGAKALDVGSGSGILSVCFARMVSPSWRVKTISLCQFASYCDVLELNLGLFLCLYLLQVGPKGKVIGIDHIKELVDDSVSNVKKDDPSLITSGRVKLIGERIVKECIFLTALTDHQQLRRRWNGWLKGEADKSSHSFEL